MIHIEKDTDVIENPKTKVATATGDYEDNALIEVYSTDEPDKIVGAFQAQFIRYGSMVYAHNGHMELGAAILKIDPESTHTSASYVRMSRELLSQMNGGSLEATSLDEVISAEKKSIEDKIEAEPETTEEPLEEVPIEETVTPEPEEPLPVEVPEEEVIVPVEETEEIEEPIVVPPPTIEELPLSPEISPEAAAASRSRTKIARKLVAKKIA